MHRLSPGHSGRTQLRLSPRGAVVRVIAVVLAVAAGFLGSSPAAIAADIPQAAVAVTKTNDLGGKPLQPGNDVTYNLYIACTSIDVDCVNFTFTDTLPSDLVLDETSLPKSTDSRTVAYDTNTHVLTIAYKQALENPTGSTGWPAGSNQTFDVTMTLPKDTPLQDGAQISNTATVQADNAPATSAKSDLTVSIPRAVIPVATKSWAGGDAVAGSGAASTITLGVRNGSSSSAQVHELDVTDATAATFNMFDLTGATLTRFPKGADTAVLEVCTTTGSDCTDDAKWTPGDGRTSTGLLALPNGVKAADVTGVRVVFTAADGSVLPHDATGGQVQLDVALRDTNRSTGEPIHPTQRTTISNCAVPTAVDEAVGTVTGDAVCATKSVLPDTLLLTPAKSFFADTNQDFTHGGNEHAVLGQNSAVTAQVQVQNASAFPISTVTIAEPSTTSSSEWNKFDTDKARITFPKGATSASVVVTYADDTTRTKALTATDTITVAKTGTRVTGVTTTFTSGDGEAAIEAGSTATMALTGRLGDTVTDADLPGGTSPGVTDCAAVAGSAGRTDGTGTYTGNACATLTVEAPVTSGTGTKSVGRTTVPAGEPVPFALDYRNNGNLPLTDVVITDPSTDGDGNPVTTGNPFTVLRITSAKVTATAGTGNATIQVFDPNTDTWTAYNEASDAVLARATGVRVLVDGDLMPGSTLHLDIVTQRRDDVADGVSIANCFVAAADGYTAAAPFCAPTVETGPSVDGATLNKSISPAVLPEYVPGLPEQTADVTLSARNRGNLSASVLGAEDADSTFFDAVDFAGFGDVTYPTAIAGTSGKIRADVLVDGVWVEGPVGTKPALPTGVTAADVTGVRVTFVTTSTVNGGNIYTPCTASSCEGKVTFHVHPRQALRTAPAQPLPETLTNTASGFYVTRLQDLAHPATIAPVSATLSFNDGAPRLHVEKSPNSTLAPGESTTFDLLVKNTGTSNLPHLQVLDQLPSGLAFDDTWQGDDGQPFTVTNVQVPEGTPAPPTPTMTLSRSGEHIDAARFDFGNFVLPPGATLTIQVRVGLAAGNAAGIDLTNTMAATTAAPGMVCDASETSTDGTYGDGAYCTDTAKVTTRSGASFEARKWVAGTASLGWYDTRTSTHVATGATSCPIHIGNDGVQYTSTPCIALVGPGDRFDYILAVVNAGTEPATHMTMVDDLPVQGDKGVLGATRGTAWDHRPTLATPATLIGKGTANIGYTAEEDYCTKDLDFTSAGCADGHWSSNFTKDATALQAQLNFTSDPLQPGESVQLQFGMTTPLEVADAGTPTIAWNSFAHTEVTQQANGNPRILAAIEPIKVGVATTYGTLSIHKTITDNPGNLDLSDTAYDMAYQCTLTPVDGQQQVVADGAITLAADETRRVEHIPAGASCAVWETDAKGAASDASDRDHAKTVTIAPLYTADDTTTTAVTVGNSYPLGHLIVTKKVDGAGASSAKGPYEIQVTCTYQGHAIPGTPETLTFTTAGTKTIDVPVGADCRVEETVTGGADHTMVEPEGAITIPADGNRSATVTVTNTFTTIPGTPGDDTDTPGGGEDAPPPSPATTPTPHAGTSTSGAGHGAGPSAGDKPEVRELAFTGASISAGAIAAVTLLLVGLVLLKARRRNG